jgi:hypothetical protein
MRNNTLSDDVDEEEETADLEVAHIIPHSLAFSNDASMPLMRLPLLVNLL